MNISLEQMIFIYQEEIILLNNFRTRLLSYCLKNNKDWDDYSEIDIFLRWHQSRLAFLNDNKHCDLDEEFHVLRSQLKTEQIFFNKVNVDKLAEIGTNLNNIRSRFERLKNRLKPEL